MKLVYMGTPAFAVPTLEHLAQAGHSIAAVYTQPDRPKGRGQALAMPPVKEAALKLGLDVRQPQRIRHCFDELKALEADAMVVVGYGQIIPQAIIDLPRHGIINVHASLLPKYRGAAPIQWSIAEGETITGVTTMLIDAGLDTGAILLTASTNIGPDETAPELSERLAAMGAKLCVDTLAGLEAGAVKPIAQDHTAATLARILEKSDATVDWNQPAQRIHDRARGFQPWPGAIATFRGQPLALSKTRLADANDLAPGQSRFAQKRLLVGCGQNTSLELVDVQPAGKKKMSASDFANGARLQPGESFA